MAPEANTPIGPKLDTDIRQFFAYSVLTRIGRSEETHINFTFAASEVYLSVFAEAIDRVETTEFVESDPALLLYAQVFERFSTTPIDGVSHRAAAVCAAGLYWLAGYTANAIVIARRLERKSPSYDTLHELLVSFLNRSLFNARAASRSDIGELLRRYVRTGHQGALQGAARRVRLRTQAALRNGSADEFLSGTLLGAALDRFARVSFWGSIEGRASASREAWRRYAFTQSGTPRPLIDLWPSQRSAIRQGLLDSRSSLVLRMPTSSGKTKLTELTFVNDLFTNGKRCLYLAPFRALVGEIEWSLGPALANLGFRVASLYGGTETNEIEIDLSQNARVVIATPEKMTAVLRATGGSLSDFGTIVLDEGHLLGSKSRGAAYELQLTRLVSNAQSRSSDSNSSRTIFLSAVLPNAQEIADWLGGSRERLVDSSWQPTALRVGVFSWPRNSQARITYVPQPGQPDSLPFFVTRVLEEDSWSELFRPTNRNRSYVFPNRAEKASIAAALALQAVPDGPVIIFSQQPRWVEAIAKSILDRLERDRPIETHLVSGENQQALLDLSSFLAGRLGPNSTITRAIANGYGLHHGGLPQSVRLVVEDAYRAGILRLLIATSTIAQGVNFPAKTVILHSLPAGDAPVRDFWNLAGRVGRAMKETDGELIVLQTDAAHARSIQRFLERDKVEPIESQILSLVRAVLKEYPAVSRETLSGLLASEAIGENRGWADAVDAIDTELLDLMTEEVTASGSSTVDQLVANLLATKQAANVADERRVKQGISDLIVTRAAEVLEAVPSAATRRRYARTALSARAAIVLDAVLPSIRAIAVRDVELAQSGFGSVVTTVCSIPELASVDAELASVLGWVWIRTGSYLEVFQAGSGQLSSLDAAITYVERTLIYDLPWALNGLVRLLETAPEAVSIPAWLRHLPQYLRFGVDREDLMWVMSLGIQERSFADWLLTQFTTANKSKPSSFRTFLEWALNSQEDLVSRVSPPWPRFFTGHLREVLERYAVAAI